MFSGFPLLSLSEVLNFVFLKTATLLKHYFNGYMIFNCIKITSASVINRFESVINKRLYVCSSTGGCIRASRFSNFLVLQLLHS